MTVHHSKNGRGLFGKYSATAILLAFLACQPTTPPNPPPQPDADAALTTPCAAACAAMTAYCGPQQPACIRVMAQLEHDQTIVNPKTGTALTCLSVASATSHDEMRAIGACGP